MRKRVIAISRELGADAEQVGRLAAERLGWRYIDEEIITSAAERHGVDPAAIADAEKRKSLILRVLEGLGEGAATSGTPGGPTWVPDDASELVRSDDFRKAIVEAIHETAARGDVVIVAHAASFALVGRDDLLRILVTSPLPIRTRRVAESLSVDDAQASKTIHRSDAARADYLKRFYGVEHERPSQYDLVVNTEVLGAAAAADLIAHAAGG